MKFMGTTYGNKCARLKFYSRIRAGALQNATTAEEMYRRDDNQNDTFLPQAGVYLNEKNQLLLGIRRASRPQTGMPSSVLSSDGMYIGLLAAATTNSCFTMFFNPRMLFETEELSVRRYMGTITSISDMDPVWWPNSHWRSVKAEPAIALGQIRGGALQNATAAEAGAYLAAVNGKIRLQAGRAIDLGLIWAVALQNATAAEPCAALIGSGRTCDCFGSDTAGALLNATVTEPGAALIGEAENDVPKTDGLIV
ncbi:hypothetical protein TSUD_31470 [Trifolium subterraneum]|uniref:Auxin response factor domain-containing protein n=1 Tax=Trifolium subterraneum TaxID=3900 RepID=A0A2Z6MBY9_TRISU|nr:hypothetical protein TSUD_31470 [Trifolium subterraneum]